jgi:ankyrin repeat protein
MSNYSIFSATSPIPDESHQMKGGSFLNNIFGQNNNKYENITKLLMDAINECNVPVIDYFLSRKFVPELTLTDVNGNNILHNLIIANTKGSELAYRALTFILSTDNSSLSSALNVQNKQGDTPLHYAIRSELDTIVSLMMMKGAKKMKNNDGFHPITETEVSETYTVITVTKPDTDLGRLFQIPEDSELERTEMPQMTNYNKPKTIQMDLIDEEPSIFESQTYAQTQDVKKSPKQTSKDNGAMDLLKEFELLLKDNKTVKDTRKSLDVGKLLDDQGVGTTEFKEYVGERKGSMIGGGSRKMISGYRIMKKNVDSEYYDQFGGESELDKGDIPTELDGDGDGDNMLDDFSDNMMSRELEMLAREAVNQKTKLHDEAIEKTLKHLKGDDKNEMSAKTIKSLIYNEVKTEKPELSGLDRATEMVKRITKKRVDELVKSKEFKDLKKIIEQKMREREERMKESKTSDTKTSDMKMTDIKSSDAKSSDAKSSDAKLSRMVDDSEQYGLDEEEYMDEELGGHESDSDYMKDHSDYANSDDVSDDVSDDEDLPKMKSKDLAVFDEDSDNVISDEIEEIETMNNIGDNINETSMLETLEDTEFKFF